MRSIIIINICVHMPYTMHGSIIENNVCACFCFAAPCTRNTAELERSTDGAFSPAIWTITSARARFRPVFSIAEAESPIARLPKIAHSYGSPMECSKTHARSADYAIAFFVLISPPLRPYNPRFYPQQNMHQHQTGYRCR